MAAIDTETGFCPVCGPETYGEPEPDPLPGHCHHGPKREACPTCSPWGAHGVPEHLWSGLRCYVDDHHRPGGMLSALLKGDLKGTACAMDGDSAKAMHAIVMYCVWEIPGDCWGTPERFDAWLARRTDA